MCINARLFIRGAYSVRHPLGDTYIISRIFYKIGQASRKFALFPYNRKNFDLFFVFSTKNPVKIYVYTYCVYVYILLSTA